jgi:hypothetical protein
LSAKDLHLPLDLFGYHAPSHTMTLKTINTNGQLNYRSQELLLEPGEQNSAVPIVDYQIRRRAPRKALCSCRTGKVDPAQKAEDLIVG